jgi:hypothetical protein
MGLPEQRDALAALLVPLLKAVEMKETYAPPHTAEAAICRATTMERVAQIFADVLLSEGVTVTKV